MKKITIAICGILTCATGFLGSVYADGFSELDRPPLADKGIFPPDDGSDDADSEDEDPEHPAPSDGNQANN